MSAHPGNVWILYGVRKDLPRYSVDQSISTRHSHNYCAQGPSKLSLSILRVQATREQRNKKRNFRCREMKPKVSNPGCNLVWVWPDWRKVGTGGNDWKMIHSVSCGETNEAEDDCHITDLDLILHNVQYFTEARCAPCLMRSIAVMNISWISVWLDPADPAAAQHNCQPLHLCLQPIALLYSTMSAGFHPGYLRHSPQSGCNDGEVTGVVWNGFQCRQTGDGRPQRSVLHFFPSV